jgi:heat shock protein HslJ
MRSITKVGLLALVLLAVMACQILPGRSGVDLTGTSWILSSLDGALPRADTVVTLQFDADGVASGSDGCNRFRTTYSQRRDSLTFQQPVASTMMACAEPVMEQAMVYMAALAATKRFTADERELILSDGDRIVATFVASSQDLAGTAWDVISYNNGREAVVGLLLDTEISAYFGAEGRLNGNAGCNQYVASYAVDENTIEISSPATTLMFCAEPPGVMEQEGEYLAALESAATYRIEGNLLEMRTAQDQIAVLMERKRSVELPAPEPTGGVPTVAVVPPTSAPRATATAPGPTPVPLPTETPLPEISFWADRTSIDSGQCTMLHWSVRNVQAVWVYPRGERYYRFPRTGQGSEQVCLVTTTTFEMQVLLLDGSTTFREVTINVAAPAPTATPAPETDPLAGTAWEVVNYNNGRGAVVSLVTGSRIFLDFDTDQQVSGSAGCNDYRASYQVDGNNLTIGLPATTNLFCAEPDGVMDQEADFLAALQSATAFRIRGDSLEIQAAGNQIALIAIRMP